LWTGLTALAGGQIAGRLLGLAAYAFLARVLDPHGYGAVEYAAGLATVAATFVDAGLGPVGVRRIARDPAAVARVSAEILGARQALAVGVALAMAGASTVLAPDALGAQLVALYAAGLLALPWSQAWLFQAVDRVHWAAAILTLRAAVFLAAVLLFVRDGGGALWVGVAELLGLALAGACSLAVQRVQIGPLRFDGAPRRALRNVAESAPIALSNVVGTLTLYGPQQLAVLVLGSATAAPFAAAHRLYLGLATFAWIYHFNLFPVLARVQARSRERIPQLVAASTRILAWGGFGVALGLASLASPLLVALFGRPFAGAAPAFGVLVWALPIFLLADQQAWMLIAGGAERAVLGVRLIGAIVLFAAGYPAIVTWGERGASAALLGAGATVWAGLRVVGRRKGAPLAAAPVLAPAAAALLALLVVRRLELAPVAAAATATLLYGAAALPFARRLAADLRRLSASRLAPAGRDD